MSRTLSCSVGRLCWHFVSPRFSRVGSLDEASSATRAASGCFCRVSPVHLYSAGFAGSKLRAQSSTAANCDDPDFDPTEARSIPSEKIIRLVDEIASLTLLEVSDLTTLLKKKLGLQNMPMMPMMGGMMPGMGTPGSGAAPSVEEKKPEKTAFDVKLEKFDAAAKIKIIKEVRTFTSLGLKEAKELVEKIPAVLKKGVSKEEASQIIEKIKAVGGTAVME